MKTYTPQEVAVADGKEGRQTLVALNGKVYDLSSSKRWVSGTHMNRHHAGADLSTDIRSAPHGIDVVSRFQCVGLYGEAGPPAYQGLRKTVEVFLEHHPFFRRHPHPAIVHFPVAFLLVAPLLQLVAVMFGSTQAEWSAFFCLVIGVVTIPMAIVTGYFTWWINYDAVDSSTIRPKRRLAWVALGSGVVCCVLGAYRLADPLHTTDLVLGVYIATLLVLGVTLGFVGFLGGRLTFPYH